MDIAATINRPEDLIESIVKNAELKILSLTGLSESVKRFIDSNDEEAPAYLVQ